MFVAQLDLTLCHPMDYTAHQAAALLMQFSRQEHSFHETKQSPPGAPQGTPPFHSSLLCFLFIGHRLSAASYTCPKFPGADSSSGYIEK